MSEEETGCLWQRGSERPHGSGQMVSRHLEVLAFALKGPGMPVILSDRSFPCCSDTVVAQGVADEAETERPIRQHLHGL